MNGKFPWFTEWNGIYMSVGEAAENQIVGCMVSIMITVFGYIFFLIYKLVSEGFKALFQGKIGPAVAYLTPLWLPVLVALFMVAGNNVQMHEHEVQATRVEQQVQTTKRDLEQNPPVEVEMWKTPTHFFFRVTNNWTGRIAVLRAGPPDFYCGGVDVWYWLDPGQTSQIIECGGSLYTEMDINSITSACISLYFEVSSYDPMWGDEPHPVVCEYVISRR